MEQMIRDFIFLVYVLASVSLGFAVISKKFSGWKRTVFSIIIFFLFWIQLMWFAFRMSHGFIYTYVTGIRWFYLFFYFLLDGIFKSRELPTKKKRGLASIVKRISVLKRFYDYFKRSAALKIEKELKKRAEISRAARLASPQCIIASCQCTKLFKGKPKLIPKILMSSYLIFFGLWLLLIFISQEQYGGLILILVPYAVVGVIISLILEHPQRNTEVFLTKDDEIIVAQAAHNKVKIIRRWPFRSLKKLQRKMEMFNAPVLVIETRRGEKFTAGLNFEPLYYESVKLPYYDSDYLELSEYRAWSMKNIKVFARTIKKLGSRLNSP